jgi:hypothetical protein
VVVHTLVRHFPVATCIGCGARNHSAECAEGCSDVPLDLVDVGVLTAMAERADALDRRVAQLRELAAALVDQTPPAWTELRDQARQAVRLPAPPEPEVDVLEAWGCPRCGRIDAPQQCLGICVRRPGAVADVSEYRQLAARSEAVATADAALMHLARMVASVRPRPGQEEQTREALRIRARELPMRVLLINAAVEQGGDPQVE